MPNTMFTKILIANRGEIALRVIRACRDLGIGTVAIYSEADRDSLHVRTADEAVCIGPAKSELSYLNIPAVISAAEVTDAEAVHPGYGFLAENPQFAEACATSGITFIGPTAGNIRSAGDKALAREIMERHGVPTVPGSEGAVADTDQAAAVARKIGLPVILKASAGGGGRGMRIVEAEEDLETAFRTAQREALSCFGNGEIYVERYLPSIRHVEVQILADRRGGIVHLGERDCSIQRRHQKLLEEAPSPAASPKFRKKVGALAVKAAKAMNYQNAGTVEFIVDDRMNVYFMEMNTRVQVEHPVTEAVTGVDIIREQIRIAAGESVSIRQSDVVITGHAIECRINAEDPERFIPSPGTINLFIPPGGPGIRVDTAAYSGWRVPPHYDSLIAKVIAHGEDRREAVARMKRALREFVVEGIRTTIPFHLRVLDSPVFLSGRFDTSFLEHLKNS